MSRTDAPLVPTDEGLNHQITETFGSVLQADRSWTEKVCLVKVTDGEAVGYANYQTVVNGEWPELGLSAENSFI